MTNFNRFQGGVDDQRLVVVRRDYSLGMVSRTVQENIPENAAYVLKNADIGVQGEVSKRPGTDQIANDVGNNKVKELYNFTIAGGGDQLLMIEGTTLHQWTGSGNWSSVKADFADTATAIITQCKKSGVSPDDVYIVQNGTDNAFEIDSDGTATDLLDTDYSIPKTLAMIWYNNRMWALKDGLLYFSDAYPTTYVPTQAAITGNYDEFAGTTGDKLKVTIDDNDFDNIDVSSATDIASLVVLLNASISGGTASETTEGYLKITSDTYGTIGNVTIADAATTERPVVNELFSTLASRTASGNGPWDRVTNAFRMEAGNQKALVATRNMGILGFGDEGVWALLPSNTPVATDRPEPIDTRRGCVAGNTVIPVGDDVYYLSQDGVRSIVRTIQDKLQSGPSFPLSYALKDEFESINWPFADKSCAVYFDNKYFIAVPTDSAVYNNEVWVYWPATQGWTVISGWNVGSWEVYKVGGEEKLYYGDATDGKVYQAWTGLDDDGVAIDYEEITRREDFGQPLTNKCGGTMELKARSIGGSYTITAYASIDGGAWTSLGTLTLTADSPPELPVDLPFTLQGEVTAKETFHLDSLGEFRTIQFKFTNGDLNTGVIKKLEHSVTTYIQEYYDE